MSQTENAATQPASTKPSSQKKLKYTVVPFPKVVFFYPLMLLCIICGVLQLQSQGDPNALAGTIFVIAFLVNVLVISFDFPGIKAMALACFVLAAVFLTLYLDSKYQILGPITEYSRAVFEKVNASPMFYFMISMILFVMIGCGILVNVLWNRWTVEPSRLYHKHGLLGDVREFPVIDLQVEKQIEDVFEHVLLLSGTLTFQPSATTAPIRLENVPFINRAERKIQSIIRAKPPIH